MLLFDLVELGYKVKEIIDYAYNNIEMDKKDVIKILESWKREGWLKVDNQIYINKDKKNVTKNLYMLRRLSMRHTKRSTKNTRKRKPIRPLCRCHRKSPLRRCSSRINIVISGFNIGRK